MKKKLEGKLKERKDPDGDYLLYEECWHVPKHLKEKHSEIMKLSNELGELGRSLNDMLKTHVSEALPEGFTISEIGEVQWGGRFMVKARCYCLSIPDREETKPKEPMTEEERFRGLAEHSQLIELLSCDIFTRNEKRKILGLAEIGDTEK